MYCCNFKFNKSYRNNTRNLPISFTTCAHFISCFILLSIFFLSLLRIIWRYCVPPEFLWVYFLRIKWRYNYRAILHGFYGLILRIILYWSSWIHLAIDNIMYYLRFLYQQVFSMFLNFLTQCKYSLCYYWSWHVEIWELKYFMPTCCISLGCCYQYTIF